MINSVLRNLKESFLSSFLFVVENFATKNGNVGQHSESNITGAFYKLTKISQTLSQAVS